MPAIVDGASLVWIVLEKFGFMSGKNLYELKTKIPVAILVQRLSEDC